MILNIFNISDLKIKYIQNTNIYDCAKYIFQKFSFTNEENILIPFELYMVVLYDVNLTFVNNKKYLEACSELNFKITIYEIITGQIDSLYNRIVPNFERDYDLFDIRNVPPSVKDFRFNSSANFYEPTNSLKLLCSYFGHTNWYKQFLFYEEGEDYFNYFDEPHFKEYINL